MAARIFLVGMMGTGKSTVGRVVARRLGWRFLDTDAEIEHRTGLSVAELFATEGEAAFRAEEARMVAHAAATAHPCVVATGGGAVLDPESRLRMAEGGVVVWLRAEVGTLVSRLDAGEGPGRDAGTRPLLGTDPAGSVHRLDAERRPVYASLADAAVDVDTLSEREVVETVLAELVPLGILTAERRAFGGGSGEERRRQR